MMVRIRDLGRVGMTVDLPTYDLPPAGVTLAENVEFRDGAIERAHGFTRAVTIPGDAVWMESWFSEGNGRSVVVTEIPAVAEPPAPAFTAFYEVIGGIATDITPASPAVSTGGEWDSAVFGKSVVLNNGVVAPFARGIDGSGDLLPMPNWPAGWLADMIRPYRNFLFALRTTIDATYDDTRIQWSNASPNNGLPPDWDDLDPASLAGGTSLAGQNGPIQDAAPLGQSLIIYMQTASVAVMLGGASVMTVRPLFNRGLLDRGCVIPFDAFHFCIGNGVIYAHDGSSLQYPAEEKTQRRFFSEMVDPASIHLANDAARKTIEVYFKTEADLAYPNRVMRWNYQTNTWTFNDLASFGVVRALYGPDSQRLTTWDEVDNQLGGGNVVAWSDVTEAWRGLDLIPGALSLTLLLRTAADSGVFRREAVYLRDGGAYVSLVEREGIDFDDILPQEAAPRGLQAVKHTKRIVPQIIGQGIVYFQFGMAMTPAGGITWGPVVPYQIETDYKVDFRASGRYFAWRMYSSVDEPATFRLSGFDLDVEGAGER